MGRIGLGFGKGLLASGFVLFNASLKGFSIVAIDDVELAEVLDELGKFWGFLKIGRLILVIGYVVFDFCEIFDPVLVK